MTNNRAKALEIVKLMLKDETIYHAVCEICPATGKYRTLKQVIEEALSEPKWKSMDSAPRDGTNILMLFHTAA